jgi:CHAT domain-containing protein
LAIPTRTHPVFWAPFILVGDGWRPTRIRWG